MSFAWAIALSVVLTSLAAALAGIVALLFLSRKRAAVAPEPFIDVSSGTVFLFDGETLLDASPAARSMLASARIDGPAWQRLMSLLSHRFPDLERRIADLPSEGRFTIDTVPSTNDEGIALHAEWRGGLSRLTLSGPESDGRYSTIDPMTQRAIEEELSMLRDVLASVPLPVWMEQADGTTIWCNREYMARIRKRISGMAQFSWPLPALTSAPVEDGMRIALKFDESGTEWLETSVCQTDKGRVITGIPTTRLVQAETTLNEFTQTLAKSFAHLPIGLAIFDRRRRLALFNPAMPDLTTLPVEFLAGRPTLSDCLDRMRELRMLPEPKDYRSWRQRMAEIEKEASMGIYEEVWYLPGAQTFRVLGRPHPDGALALLFEDITTETARTRRYRADIELGQSVMDQMDEAVAVFSAAGLLVMSNAAYTALWGHDPSGFVGAKSTILALASHWRSHTAPTKLWGRAEAFVATLGDRKEWSAAARLRDGRSVTCRFIPLSGGSTMISFRVAASRPRRISLPENDVARQLA